MLEAAGFDAVDSVLLSLSVLVDIFSGLKRTAEGTSVMIAYVDIVSFVFSRQSNFEWIVENNFIFLYSISQ